MSSLAAVRPASRASSRWIDGALNEGSFALGSPSGVTALRARFRCAMRSLLWPFYVVAVLSFVATASPLAMDWMS